MPTTLSIVVVNYRRRDLLSACLDSVQTATERLPDSAELIVVDNGSDDGSADLVRTRFPEAVLVQLGENRGFSGAVNRGIAVASGEWILTLNNDTTLEPDAPAALLDAVAGQPEVGSAAAQLRFIGAPPRINSAGVEVDRLGVAFDRLVGAPPTASEKEPVEVFGASAGAALYRRAMLADVGLLDESFFTFLEDVDLAWRARLRGWRCLYVPTAVVHHHHSATAIHGSPEKYFNVGRNRVRLLAKHMPSSHLLRYGLPMIAYDLGYVVYAAAREGTLAPLRGRLAGLRDWSDYRREGAGDRRPLDLVPIAGMSSALARRRTWSNSSAVSSNGAR